MENKLHILQKKEKARNIEFLYRNIKDSIKNSIFLFYSGEISEEQEVIINGVLEQKLEEFNACYTSAKKLFFNIFRDNGDRYFDHILGAVEVYIDEFVTYNGEDITEFIINEIDRINTILQHDTLEDKDKTFETLKEITSPKVALSVALMSKTPFYYFILDIPEEQEDKNTLKELKNKGILNEKFLLCDELKLKLYLDSIEKTDKEKSIISLGRNYTLTDDEKLGIYMYKQLKKKYKSRSTTEYYERFSSIENLMEAAKKINILQKLGLREQDMKEAVENAIYAKTCDRYDNIDDIIESWDDRPEKIERKLTETERHILPLLKDFDIYAYSKLTELVNEKRTELNSKQIGEYLKVSNNKAHEVL